MTDAILLATGERFLDFLESKKNDEVLKRLFIQECRYNLSILSLKKWKGSDKFFLKYLIKNLKLEIASVMHCKYKNDFFHFTTSQAKKILNYKDPEEKFLNDTFLQLINKISILKVIAEIPIELYRYDKSNLDKRISNLNELLVVILEDIQKK